LQKFIVNGKHHLHFLAAKMWIIKSPAQPDGAWAFAAGSKDRMPNFLQRIGLK